MGVRPPATPSSAGLKPSEACNVSVVLRVRPLTYSEIAAGDEECVEVLGCVAVALRACACGVEPCPTDRVAACAVTPFE